MLSGRHSSFPAMNILIIQQTFRVLAQDAIPDGFVKLIRPAIAILHIPADHGQIVNDIAAGKNQSTFLPQRLQFSAGFIKLFWRSSNIDADHDNRNICLWKQVE